MVGWLRALQSAAAALRCQKSHCMQSSAAVMSARRGLASLHLHGAAGEAPGLGARALCGERVSRASSAVRRQHDRAAGASSGGAVHQTALSSSKGSWRVQMTAGRRVEQVLLQLASRILSWAVSAGVGWSFKSGEWLFTLASRAQRSSLEISIWHSSSSLEQRL
jgi:hypothetical protein